METHFKNYRKWITLYKKAVEGKDGVRAVSKRREQVYDRLNSVRPLEVEVAEDHDSLAVVQEYPQQYSLRLVPAGVPQNREHQEGQIERDYSEDPNQFQENEGKTFAGNAL